MGRHGSLAVKSWGVVGITVFWDQVRRLPPTSTLQMMALVMALGGDSVAPAPLILKVTEVHSITQQHAGWGFQVLLESMASLGIFLMPRSSGDLS